MASGIDNDLAKDDSRSLTVLSSTRKENRKIEDGERYARTPCPARIERLWLVRYRGQRKALV